MILDCIRYLVEVTPYIASPFRVRTDTQAEACGYNVVVKERVQTEKELVFS